MSPASQMAGGSSGEAFCQLAEVANLPLFQSAAEARALEAGLSLRQREKLALAIEEVFVNICHYAYPNHAPGNVNLTCREAKEAFIVELMDNGAAFDVDDVPVPNLDADADDRPVGGLGWFLVRRLVDELECRREAGHNLVRLTVHHHPPSPR